MTDEETDLFRRLVGSAARMQTLVTDVLRLSKFSDTTVVFEPVSLNAVIDRSRDDLELAIGEQGAELRAGALPTVPTEPAQMHQLLLNLVSNALKFQDKSGDIGEDVSGGADSSRLRSVFGKEAWGNYEIRTFRLIRGNYEEVTLDVNNKLFFPRLFKPTQKGALEGTLYFRQAFFYSRGFVRYPLKFRLRIRDRALNVSNTIETDTIVLPLIN